MMQILNFWNLLFVFMALSSRFGLSYGNFFYFVQTQMKLANSTGSKYIIWLKILRITTKTTIFGRCNPKMIPVSYSFWTCLMLDRLEDHFCEPNFNWTYFKITTNEGEMQYVRFWKWGATTLLYINNLVFTFFPFWRLFSNGGQTQSHFIRSVFALIWEHFDKRKPNYRRDPLPPHSTPWCLQVIFF